MTLYRPLSVVLLMAVTSLATAQEATQPHAAPSVDSTGSDLSPPTITNETMSAAPSVVSPAPDPTPPAAMTPVAPVAARNPAPGAPSSTTVTAAAAVDVATSGAVAPTPMQVLSPQEEMRRLAEETSGKALTFLREGGPSIWAIAALSVITLALILWKIWRLALIGAWSRGKASKAVLAFEAGNPQAALAIVDGRMGIRSKVVSTAITALRSLPEERAREETARVAKKHLARAGTGLGALELIATIAPLLGLLGTVLGMIAAFQALQQSGSKADPALLAGGIWEALLTTAAGMAVAIPASAALTWFEAVIARIRQDIEDSATRLFVAEVPQDLQLAAE